MIKTFHPLAVILISYSNSHTYALSLSLSLFFFNMFYTLNVRANKKLFVLVRLYYILQRSSGFKALYNDTYVCKWKKYVFIIQNLSLSLYLALILCFWHSYTFYGGGSGYGQMSAYIEKLPDHFHYFLFNL